METPTYRQRRFRQPDGATSIILVRHGESEPAVPGVPFPLVDGHGDPALAPDGREQARAVASRLAAEQLDALYVTTLRRTVQTAAPLVALTGLEPTVEPDLREVHLGEWEGGLYRQKAAEGDPIIDLMVSEQRWDVIPGAEPADRLNSRVESAVNRIAAAHRGGRVAVFSHGGVIGTVLALATGSRALAFVGCDNGSISQIVVFGDQWYVRRVNDTSHLSGGLDRPEGDHQVAPSVDDPSSGSGFSS
ncbi:MAG: histidine phosphatase family protein [Aquihabitans sp.]